MDTTHHRIEMLLRESPTMAQVLERWDGFQLPDCWLVAGSIAQTVWNAKFGFPPNHGISDIDIVYFDPDDLSTATEQRHSDRIKRLFADISVRLDVKNEARVHIWYAQKFGYPVEPYQSTKDAICTFPTTATAVGVRPTEERLEVYAPYGLDDLLGGIIRANKTLISQKIYEDKVARWLGIWPGLTVIDWNDGPVS